MPFSCAPFSCEHTITLSLTTPWISHLKFSSLVMIDLRNVLNQPLIIERDIHDINLTTNLITDAFLSFILIHAYPFSYQIIEIISIYLI